MLDLSGTPSCVVTGANGYVGAAITRYLEARNWNVVPWTRQPPCSSRGKVFRLGEEVDRNLLRGVRALVHCAYDFKPRNWNEINAVNVNGSEKLFQAASEAGVQSVVLLSSLSAFEGCRSLYGRAKLQIERIAQSRGIQVIRPGLIYGERPGGVFGRLSEQVRSSRVVPRLWGGRQLQYLLHVEDLGNLVLGCLNGQVPAGAGPVAVAHHQGWELKEILLQIARAMRKRVTLVPIPWRLVWLGLRALELANIPTGFRSDSLVGMVYQNPNPSFALLKSLGFQCRSFQISCLTFLAQPDLPVEREH